MSEPADLQAERDALLPHLLDAIAADGWTRRAYEQAAAVDPAIRHLFADGIDQVADHFAFWADRQMETRLDGVDLGSLRVRDRIALLVRTRLEALAPYREVVRREAAWSLLAGPDRAPRLLWRTADRMWRLAGDTATDLNHYSKRALLAGVLVSTTICWLGDDTPDHAATAAFLDRRIDEVLRLGKSASTLMRFAYPTRALDVVAGLAARARYRT